MSTPNQLLSESRDLLIAFAASIGHRVDSQRAERVLNESHLNRQDSFDEDWYATVSSCAEALEFRIRKFESKLSEAVELVHNGLSVATLIIGDDGRPTWISIIRESGNRVLVETLADGVVKWKTIAQLKQMLGLISLDMEATWLVCYPILIKPSDDAGGDQGKKGAGPPKKMPPLTRLLEILRAETGDINVIVVFALVVGLLTLTTPIAVEVLVNLVVFGQYVQPVLILAFIVFVLLSFSASMTALSVFVAEIMQRRLFVRLVEDLAYRLPRVRQSLIDTKSLPELTNRFLEIANLQKMVSKLFLDSIAIVMQTLIGMTVLAFYHPFLLGFNIILLLMITFTIMVLGRGGIKTAISVSTYKFQVLSWLEDLGRNPSAFKLNDGTELAISRADHLTVKYVDARRTHFKIVFRQVLFSLFMYCIATAVLLGLGGWLVIIGEISLGQLIAAELIVMLIVGSFSKLGQYADSFFDLMASVDKIGALIDLPMESYDKLLEVSPEDSFSLDFDNVSLTIAGQKVVNQLNFSVAPGSAFAVIDDGHSATCYVVDLCLAIRTPDSGTVSLNGISINEYRFDSIREWIGVARDIEVFEGGLEENVHLYRPDVSSRQVWWALEKVGLLELVEKLPDGAQTKLPSGGFPLTKNQCRRLMLARAMVGGPRMIVIDRLLDAFSKAEAKALIEILKSDDITLLVFTECHEIGELFENFVNIN